MSKTKDFSESFKKIEAVLAKDCVFAFVLGSFGTERFNAESDIDIAGFFSPSLETGHKIKLSSLLAKTFDRDVDLVDLSKTDFIFARQVLETGRLVFTTSPTQLLEWKIRVLGMYPDFKRSREIVEKSLLRRKGHV